MSVEVVKKQQNDDINFDSNDKGVQATNFSRPMTAKPQPKGEPIAIKQMIFFDGNKEDISNQVEHAIYAYVKDKPQPSLKEKKVLPANPSQSSQIVAHQKRLQSAKMQKQVYQSQYHFDDDYENEK